MVEQASINLKHFNEMEKHLLDQVVEVSKSMIESSNSGLFMALK